MEGNITTTMEPLNLVTHVFEEKTVFLKVDLQTPPQEPQQELHSSHRYHTLNNTASVWLNLLLTTIFKNFFT